MLHLLIHIIRAYFSSQLNMLKLQIVQYLQAGRYNSKQNNRRCDTPFLFTKIYSNHFSAKPKKFIILNTYFLCKKTSDIITVVYN